MLTQSHSIQVEFAYLKLGGRVLVDFLSAARLLNRQCPLDRLGFGHAAHSTVQYVNVKRV